MMRMAKTYWLALKRNSRLYLELHGLVLHTDIQLVIRQ